MLYEFSKKVRTTGWVKALRSFFRSGWYLALVVALMVCAYLFTCEFFVYWIYLLFGILIVLFDDDLRECIPIFLCCYMSVSYKNGPGLFNSPDGEIVSIFCRPVGQVQLCVLIGLAVAILIARLITIATRRQKRGRPALLFGFFALGLAYIFGGLFSPYYDLRTAFFGFVEIISLCATYFIFFYGVDWENSEKEYFAKLFMAIGGGVLLEIICMNYFAGTIVNDEFTRKGLATGWGMYNNVGCAMAMCMPAPFYFAATKKRGWIFTTIGLAYMLGVALTFSRGAILFGGIVFLACIIVVLVKSKGKKRLLHLAVLGVAAAIALIVALVCRSLIERLVSELTAHGGFFSSDARIGTYKEGWEQFKAYPFFGVGFYQCNGYQFGNFTEGSFLPPRYHDTYIQLLASGGIVALICYAFHRLQTLLLLFRRFSIEKLFMAFCIASLILTSIVDCHFFNFGPGLMYGVLLVCAEGENLKSKNKEALVQ